MRLIFGLIGIMVIISPAQAPDNCLDAIWGIPRIDSRIVLDSTYLVDLSSYRLNDWSLKYTYANGQLAAITVDYLEGEGPTTYPNLPIGSKRTDSTSIGYSSTFFSQDTFYTIDTMYNDWELYNYSTYWALETEKKEISHDLDLDDSTFLFSVFKEDSILVFDLLQDSSLSEYYVMETPGSCILYDSSHYVRDTVYFSTSNTNFLYTLSNGISVKSTRFYTYLQEAPQTSLQEHLIPPAPDIQKGRLFDAKGRPSAKNPNLILFQSQ